LDIVGIFGDLEICEYSRKCVKKEDFSATVVRGLRAAACKACPGSWNFQCQECVQRSTPVIYMSYIMAFARNSAYWNMLAQAHVPVIIVDSPYRVPFLPCVRKQSGVWVATCSGNGALLWQSWSPPPVTHPQGYFVPFTNKLAEPRTWGFVSDMASLFYIASIYPGSAIANYSEHSDEMVLGMLKNIGLTLVAPSDRDVVIVCDSRFVDLKGRWCLDLRTGKCNQDPQLTPFDPFRVPSVRSLHRGAVYESDYAILASVGPVAYDIRDGKTTFWCTEYRGQARVVLTFGKDEAVSKVVLHFHGDET
jgi:hypothetical protein